MEAYDRRETVLERCDRNLVELLQEVRVVQTGVQVLFAFLLTAPLAARFPMLTQFQRQTYFVTLLVTGAAAILLIAPTAHHRILFRLGDKEHLVVVANRFTLAGLGCVALSIVGAVLLVTDLLFGGAAAIAAAAIVAGASTVCWFAGPLSRRAKLLKRRVDGNAARPIDRPMALHPSTESFTLARYAEYLCDPESAVRGALGVPAAAYRDAVRAAWWPDPPRDHYGARPELALLLRAVIRLTRPTTVVETGVAQGVTTAVILRAMAENREGTLYSIDVPPPHADDAYVGSLVPDALRSRWTLLTGLSQDELVPLLTELGTIDVFLHDAVHRYETQTEEYAQAWPRLRAGGLLMTDDVDTPAFMDFAARVGGAPFLIGVPSSKSGVGLMRKP